MSADNFDECLAFVLKHEGGYVDHPSDPGGETNFGISKRAYPMENIKAMTRERAAAIYRRDYWDAVKGDQLPAGLDLVAFDAAVNSGQVRGAIWLQRALGVADDGIIGPITLAAAEAADVGRTIDMATEFRLEMLQRLSTWRTFGRGWKNRVDGVRKAAKEMADRHPRPAAAVETLEQRVARLEMQVSAMTGDGK